jgi:Ca2+-binding RTX toxin-like protein
MSATTGINSIDALAYSSWSLVPGTAATLTYRFLSSVPDGATADDAKGFQMMTFAQQQATRAALSAWAAVAKLDFVEVSSGGQLRFGTNDQSVDNSSGYAYLPEPGVASVDLYLNNRGYYNSVFAPGSFGPSVLLHEIGHTLGLKHPGDYDSAGGSVDGPYLPAATDNTDYSVMSYHQSGTFNGRYDVTPMLYDIQAIQYLYGANTSYHAGDDVYAFGSSQAPVCIWDGGGNNTFDFSACYGATEIDLHAGAFSGTSTGLTNVSIAYNVVIRTVLTGAGGSTVTLNDAGDVMKGGSGADVVRVGAGDDIINAGEGADTVVFSGRFADYSIVRTVDEVRVAGQGLDVLSGVEQLQFADLRVSVAELAMTGPAGGTSGNDTLLAVPGNEFIDGGLGLDTLVYASARGPYLVRASGKGYTVTDGGGSVDVLSGVERVVFSDGGVALDADGAAGQVYRLYRAALDRTPDSAGQGFWMVARDGGADLVSVARSFVESAEFQARYGSYDNTQFVTQLYTNALHRAPDEAGLAWHVANLNNGLSRAQVVVDFAESAECQGAVASLIGNGMEYTPFG